MQWWYAAASLAALMLALGLVYVPLGDYMARMFTTDKDWRVEKVIYKLIGVNPARQQSWRGYLRAVLAFSSVGMLLLYAMQRCQQWLPFSLGHGPVSPWVAFNTAASYVGNTNWQAYSPEQTMGFTVQMAGLAVQSFVSVAAGLAVAIALVRGLAARRTKDIGNFWVDLIRTNIRLLLPLAMVATIGLIIGGVVQNFTGFTQITTIAGGTQAIPGGPVASQEAIKMLGTNGGGFFNANSAHPLENPTPMTNMFQSYLLLVVPFALPRTFGKMVDDHRLGDVVAATMGILFVAAYWGLTAAELAGGVMEGKEQRFGIIGSVVFTAATTGTTGGAINSNLDSFTPLGGLVAMLHMILGEVTPGGIGSGLYTILILMVIAVFLTGLLVGRTPVLLGKRLGPTELKLAGLGILIVPMVALFGMAISLAIPPVRTELLTQAMGNSGTHGVSEMLYAFYSAAVNNGSAFSGFNADTPWLNTVLGLMILLGRFLVIAIVLALAGAFAAQDKAPRGVGELPLRRPQFIGLLTTLILFIGVPTFFAILTAGPLAEGLR